MFRFDGLIKTIVVLSSTTIVVLMINVVLFGCFKRNLFLAPMMVCLKNIKREWVMDLDEEE